MSSFKINSNSSIAKSILLLTKKQVPYLFLNSLPNILNITLFSTQENIKKLQEFGNKLIPANHGYLASGLVGEGRMAEPEDVASIVAFLASSDAAYITSEVIMVTGGQKTV